MDHAPANRSPGTMFPEIDSLPRAEAEAAILERDRQSRRRDRRSDMTRHVVWTLGRAARVLELLDVENPNGTDVYKIYELAEGNPDNRKEFQARFGVSPYQFLRFKDAVHKATVTGDWARHAIEEEPKTENPMSRDEAEEFVRELAGRWLQALRGPEAHGG